MIGGERLVMSKRTKECRNKKIIFSVLHFLCLFGPMLYFIPYSYMIGTTVQKVSLTFTVVVSFILAMISMIVSVNHKAGLHKSIMWIMIAGVLFTLQEIKSFIWIMCVVSILDELVFVKLKDYYKAALISNKEIDRRGL